MILLVTGFSSTQGCGAAATPPRCAPASAARTASIDAISATLERIKEADELGAILFSSERDGVPILRTALGESTPGAPATTDMHFRIGGVGWQYLTTILLRMVERDQLELTDPVSQWHPSYPYADRARVRMLGASSAGFADYLVDAPTFLEEVAANPLRVWTADDLITRSRPPYKKGPVFTNPGQDWAYSHTEFVMLGAILEKVGGKDYAALLKELVLDPLGLRNTRIQLDADPQQPVLHTLADETFEDSTYWNPSLVSWAAMTSNICDLGTWTRAFGTGALLSPSSRSEITAPVNVGLGGNTSETYFGLGTLVYTPWIVQRASYWGMFTTTAYDPTTGFSIEATASLSPDSPPGISPADEIVFAVSRILTPDHPISRWAVADMNGLFAQVAG